MGKTSPTQDQISEIRAAALLQVSRDYECMGVDPDICENLKRRAAVEAANTGLLLSDIDDREASNAQL